MTERRTDQIPRFVGWPHCAVCNAPVAEVERHVDDRMQQMVYTAICHGDREVTTLGRRDVLLGGDFEFSVAFRPKLPEPVERIE